MSIEPGQTAPDFTLADEQGADVTLASFRGERSVTLVFIPFAFTGVCQGELCELRDNLGAFETADNQVLVVTCDRAPSLKACKAEQRFNFPMLSDGWPHGAVAQLYDCFNADLGCAFRRTVVIGKDGVITDVFQSGGLGEARSLDSYSDALTHVSG